MKITDKEKFEFFVKLRSDISRELQTDMANVINHCTKVENGIVYVNDIAIDPEFQKAIDKMFNLFETV